MPPPHDHHAAPDTSAGPDRSGQVRAFRVVAVVEAVSYLLLIAASIAKRVFDATDLVPVMGPVHGVIFLVYLVMALTVRDALRWPLSTTLFVVVAAVIPLGGIYVEQRVVHVDASA